MRTENNSSSVNKVRKAAVKKVSVVKTDSEEDFEPSPVLANATMSKAKKPAKARDAECLKVPRPTHSMLKNASLKKVPRKIPNGSKLK